MLDVSQRVVREALGLLAGEGLIVKRHGRGAFVQATDRERLRAELVIPSTQFPSIRDLHEARCALEIGAMYVAAQHATEDDIRKLEDVLDSMAGALRDEKILLPDDLRFHLTLLEVTHNDTLRSLAFMISESIRQNVYLKPGMLRRRLEDESHVLSAHRTIVDALSEEDGTKAALAMHTHLRRTLEGELDA